MVNSYIHWSENHMKKKAGTHSDIMSLENVAKAQAFHGGLPQYNKTPLIKLDNMAAHLGLAALCVKDESCRLGLNAFKVLGGSFAMARYIASQMGRDISDITYDYLTSSQFLDEFGQVTFYTATDGNHGRGVAWAANKLHQKAVVHMPKGSSKERFDNIVAEGAVVTIEDVNYDDCVRIAAEEAAADERGIVIQDTAWDGYEEIPIWIMQGYGTMAAEASKQLADAGIECPTHVFVQAGVGSLAGAVVGYFANLHPTCPPKFVIMEASAANCLYRSVVAGDGTPHIVGGSLQTIMAGLACGEPNAIAWNILRNNADVFISCPDWVAARGMRMMAAPVGGDPVVVSGESGAVGMGAIASIMTDPAYISLREELCLDQDSRVLLFSTEGDTDSRGYHRIVWDGECPSY